MILVLDLDGTVLTDDKQIPPSVMRAISDCVGHHIKVVLATARPPRSSIPFWKKLGLMTPLICYNGGLTYDVPDKAIIDHVPLENAIAQELVSTARSFYPDVIVSLECKDKWLTNRWDSRYLVATAKEGFEPDYVGDLTEALSGKDISKMLFLGSEIYINDLKSLLESRFLKKISLAMNEPFCIQINAVEATKENAVERLLEKWNKSWESVLAIGDGENDMGMLVKAGLAIAVENAHPMLHDVVTDVVPNNNLGGVAFAIDKYVLPTVNC